MEITAVEFLIEEIECRGITTKELRLAFEQAKEMEKQQIENAYFDGGQDVPLTEERCRQYYNETFKNK